MKIVISFAAGWMSLAFFAYYREKRRHERAMEELTPDNIRRILNRLNI